MRKRYDLLEEIGDRLSDGAALRSPVLDSFNDEALQRLLNKQLDYYEINDLETGDFHGKIFKALYVDKEFSSYDSIAGYFNLHAYTLDRYRQRYNRLAEKLLQRKLDK